MSTELTFETASAQLDEIHAQLAQDDTTLSVSLELYAKAAELIAFCAKVLEDAQMTIEEINAKYLPQE